MFTKNSKYDDHAIWSVVQILPSSAHPFLAGVLLLNLIARLSDLVDLVNISLGMVDGSEARLIWQGGPASNF